MPPRPSSLFAATQRASRSATKRNNVPFSSRTMSSTGTPSGTAQAQAQASADTTATAPSFSSIGIKRTTIETAPGVTLSEHQKVLVGSVLDLFEGNPTLKHFTLWEKDATFADNITVAQGHARYTAQFYGLPALFSPIRLQSHRVTSAGDPGPIEVDMSNKYVVKGIRAEKVMNSVVRIHVGAGGRIARVEDRWGGELPSGAVSDVSGNLMNPRTWGPLAAARWAVRAGGDAAWWAFCACCWWSPFLAFRKLNAVTVPALVKVPKTEEEDMMMKAEREKQ
ncbi:hypothetical protein KVR01_009290 [Diaporthe batatas]|uniref:uncharacterized protein n=1 Tax=Diaporthe batatas TaxID=748121 RepID=UPI001D04EA57|nr:uncharacterized protein KVR01_009290 [Diaporthe batatas]KAG8161026.1 hypothetical protein KVR01_009290 [Diaporthe batatas]